MRCDLCFSLSFWVLKLPLDPLNKRIPFPLTSNLKYLLEFIDVYTDNEKSFYLKYARNEKIALMPNDKQCSTKTIEIKYNKAVNIFELDVHCVPHSNWNTQTFCASHCTYYSTILYTWMCKSVCIFHSYFLFPLFLFRSSSLVWQSI